MPKLPLITEPSNADYDNDVSDNCDHNFGTFDDFGVKNDQKVSNNMILMSKYKGKRGGKKGQKIRAPPHHSGNARKKTFFFSLMSSLIVIVIVLQMILEKDNIALQCIGTSYSPYMYQI